MKTTDKHGQRRKIGLTMSSRKNWNASRGVRRCYDRQGVMGAIWMGQSNNVNQSYQHRSMMPNGILGTRTRLRSSYKRCHRPRWPNHAQPNSRRLPNMEVPANPLPSKPLLGKKELQYQTTDVVGNGGRLPGAQCLNADGLCLY